MKRNESELKQNARILLVEDSLVSAKITRDMLTKLGFSVLEASTGSDAIQMVNETQPDLILMDIVLKGKMDGVEAAERIRSQFDIPVVYLSDFSEEEIVQRAKITTPFGYLIKTSINENVLRTTIEIALYNHRTEMKLRESQRLIEKTFETSFDGIAVIDLQGDILLANHALEDMSGYSKQELEVLSLSQITIGPEFIDRLIESAKGGQKIIQFETTLVPRGLQSIPVALSSGSIEEEKILVVFRDLRIEKELSEELKLFRSFTLDHFCITLFKMGEKGPELVVTEQLPFANDSEEQLLTRIGLHYVMALGQGNVINTGLFGPLPMPRIPGYLGLAYSFLIADPSDFDPRTEGRTFSFIVLSIPEALMHLFSNRAVIQEIFERELSQIATIQDIDLSMLKMLKQRILRFDDSE